MSRWVGAVRVVGCDTAVMSRQIGHSGGGGAGGSARRERAVTCGIVVRCAPCDMAMAPMRADVPRACGRAVDSTRVRGRSESSLESSWKTST